MNKKQKEALVIALAENGKTYREIAKEAGVSPNTIKLVLNRTGLDQNTSTSSRAFELFAEGKNPLQVAIALNLNAEKAIQYHQEYFMLLGCSEFTKVYPQIKDNPWPYVNFVKLVQNAGMSDSEVVESLKIANGYLPWIRIEYDRIMAQLNSRNAELSNVVRIYQQFVDSNIALKRREVKLQQTIDELESNKTELQKRSLIEPLTEFRENNNNDVVVTMNDISIQQPTKYFNQLSSG
ncbi:MAG: helix-turn-helix domain-containing protein [Nitrososphaeraceae archaeon]